MRALRRIPAVSMKRTGPCGVSTMVSIVSRVVPGRSCTTARSSPVRRLNSVDLPTFGRPTRVTPTTRGSPPSGSTSVGTSSTTSGRAATMRSSMSPAPRPCRALTGIGSPRPSDMSSHIDDSCTRSSTLLAIRITGLSVPRRRVATWASASVTPTVVSTTNSTTSASAMARSLWRLTFSSRESPSAIQPPVSTRVNSRPCQLASTSLRSRVTPGRSSTIASRRPRILFISVDLPTLGRPTIATVCLIAPTPPSPGHYAAMRRRWPPPRPPAAGPPAASRPGTARC